MKKQIAALVLLLAAAGAEASSFDTTIDAREMADAMAHCPLETARLLPVSSFFYVSNVVGRFTQVNKDVSIKGYDINTQRGGGFEPVTKGQTLSIEMKVTQPPENVQDMPSRVEWTCKFFD